MTRVTDARLAYLIGWHGAHVESPNAQDTATLLQETEERRAAPTGLPDDVRRRLVWWSDDEVADSVRANDARMVLATLDSLAARLAEVERERDMLGRLAADSEVRFKAMREAVANDDDRERYDEVLRINAAVEKENDAFKVEGAALRARNAKLEEALRGILQRHAHSAIATCELTKALSDFVSRQGPRYCRTHGCHAVDGNTQCAVGAARAVLLGALPREGDPPAQGTLDIDDGENTWSVKLCAACTALAVAASRKHGASTEVPR